VTYLRNQGRNFNIPKNQMKIKVSKYHLPKHVGYREDSCKKEVYTYGYLHFKNQRLSQINNLMTHLNVLEKQAKLKISERKEIIKVRIKIS
jgi:hypothetical protein